VLFDCLHGSAKSVIAARAEIVARLRGLLEAMTLPSPGAG